MKIAIFDNSIDIIHRLKELVIEAEPTSTVEYAVDYEVALSILPAFSPNLVVLDISFNNNDPFTLIKEIKTKLKNATVIVLSIHLDEIAKQKCHLLGADYFFDKYHEFEKIPEVINSMAAA